MQELVRLQLQIQARIAAVRNASEASLSYQEVQTQNIKIKELFLELEEKLQIWKCKSEENLNVQEGLQMKEQVKRHQAELSNLKDSLRKANLKVKMDRERQEVLDRQKLLGNAVASLSGSQYGEAKAQKRQIRTQEDALKESKNVIEGLKRLRNMMANETQLGQEILVELDDQGKVIHSAVSDLDEMHGRIRKGRGWLSLLRRREVTDKMLISLALIFFCFVCFYILKVRLRITFFGYWPW
jgi:protein transport protein SEC20